MKDGDIVLLCPKFPDVGVYLGNDPEFSQRSLIFCDDECIYSIPTFQLEVIDEAG